MINSLAGETWDVFLIEGRKAGVLRRVTAPADEAGLFVTTLNVIYGQAVFQHEFYLYDRPGYPAHSYLFDTNDGAPVHVEFNQGEMSCQIDDEVFVENVPCDARPAYGNYPLLVTIPFEENLIVSYTQIDDGSCTVLGQAELVSKGWEDVVVNQKLCKLWQVEEYLNGQLGNKYWLNASRQLKRTHWAGAVSFQVETKEKAVAQLSKSSLDSFKIALETANQPDWIDEIGDWLNQAN